MIAARTLVDMGLMCEDVSKYILVDYLIGNNDYWKSKYNNCITDLTDKINSGICDAAYTVSDECEIEYEEAYRLLKQQPENFDRLFAFIFQFINYDRMCQIGNRKS